jgi:hypothetical protein
MADHSTISKSDYAKPINNLTPGYTETKQADKARISAASDLIQSGYHYHSQYQPLQESLPRSLG